METTSQDTVLLSLCFKGHPEPTVQLTQSATVPCRADLYVSVRIRFVLLTIAHDSTIITITALSIGKLRHREINYQGRSHTQSLASGL